MFLQLEAMRRTCPLSSLLWALMRMLNVKIEISASNLVETSEHEECHRPSVRRDPYAHGFENKIP